MVLLRDSIEHSKWCYELKHAAKFGVQWDQYLSGVLWAYRNTPHSSTGEKPSFLLYGFDCRTPTEAALLPAKPLRPTNVSDYREQMMLSLLSARNLANEVNRGSQKKYKAQYDKSARDPKLKIGDGCSCILPRMKLVKIVNLGMDHIE